MAEDPAPADQVRIRCYGGLLGDCYLLRFPREDGAPFWMLIDFGVLQGMAEGAARLPRIAEDVRALTGGFVDVIVGTHRHWDHLCGFGKHPGMVDRAGEVWLSWVEDPDDAQGAELLGAMDQTALWLREKASGLGVSDTDEAALTAAMLDFVGPVDGWDEELGVRDDGRGRLTTQACLRELKAKGPPRFLAPGSVAELPGTGVRAYVLGPPRSEARLRDQEPSADGREVYPVAAHLAAATADLATGRSGEAYPFELGKGWPLKDRDEARADDYRWLDERLGVADWRRFDGANVSGVALDFDRVVNNTSLVLALELPRTRHVLLFPGDAQVGNWLSWHDVAWSDGTRADDLLARTTFLKVAHHGSVNATVRAGGLEAMTSPLLSAHIPVVERFARGKTRPWDMPHGATNAALLRRTGDRVARGDRGPAADADGGPPGAGRFSSFYLLDEGRRPPAERTPFWTEYAI